MITNETIKNLNDLDTEQKIIALSVGVVLDRMKRLSIKRKTTLLKIFKHYWDAPTTVERATYCRTIIEILEQIPIKPT